MGKAAKDTFASWMRKVDDYVWRKAGCSVYDLDDCPFRDWYDDGVTPRRAALKAIEFSG